MNRESSLPLPQATLRYLLGSGLRPLGLASPPGSALGASQSQVLGFLEQTFLGIAPHDPVGVFQGAYAGFGFARRSASPKAQTLSGWLGRIGGSAQSAPSASTLDKTGLVEFGKGTPLVGVYATEGLGEYAGEATPANAAPPTSRDLSKNVLGIARDLAQALAAQGVPTLYSGTANDGEGELGAYLNSAQTVQSLKQAAPGLPLMLDVERPATGDGSAVQKTAGGVVATIALVVGTDTRLPDPNWHQNLALAKALGADLQREAGSVFRGITMSPDRLNQQMAPTLLQIDIGGPQATPQEAQAAIGYAVRAIVAYLGGAAQP